MRQVFFFTLVFFTSLFVSKAQVSGKWQELGTGTNALNVNNQSNNTPNAHIIAIATDQSGNVYAAGSFGSSNNYVARWNGTNWSPLGSFSTSNTIYALTVDKLGNVYAGGDFVNTNNNRYVAKWNGSSWSELGGNNSLMANGTINTIANDMNGNIYASGHFTDNNSNTYVAKWNGSKWTNLGAFSGAITVNSLAIDNMGVLYAGGYFIDINGKFYITYLNGTSWAALGGTTLSASNPVLSITTDINRNVYAAGTFIDANNKLYVAQWNGTSWNELGTGSDTLNTSKASSISSITSDSSGNVYASVNYTNGTGTCYVAKWNGTSWNQLGNKSSSLNANNSIYSIITDKYDNVFAAGSFTDANQYQYVAEFNPLPTVISPVTYCQNATSVALSATPSVSNAVLKWYTDSTGGSASFTAPFPNLTKPDTTILYYVSQTINNNEGPRIGISVIVKSAPNPPLIDTTQTTTYCQFSQATYLKATGLNLKWYTIDTVGSVGSTIIPTPITSKTGETFYYLSQTSYNGCESNKDTIQINVIIATAIPAVSDSILTFCQFDTTAKMLSATGTKLTWYKQWKGGDSILTSAPTPQTLLPDTTTYFVTQTLNGCESNKQAITITVNAQPSPPVTASIVNYYPNDPSVALSATGNNFSWHTLSKSGGDSLLATAPIPPTTSDTIMTYFVNQTTNKCTSLYDTILVIVSTIPPPPFVVDTNYCIYSTVVDTLKATPLHKSDSIYWYSSLTATDSSLIAPFPITSTIDTTYYYASQYHNGLISKKASLRVIIYTYPKAPIVTSPVTYCQNATKVDPLTATGASLKWYFPDTTAGTGSTKALVPTTTQTGATNYYVSQTVNGCESPKTAIDVIIQAPSINITVHSKLPFCSGSSILLTCTPAISYSWKLDTTSVGNNTDSLIVSQPGNYSVTILDLATGCSGTSAAKTIKDTTQICFDCANVLNGKATVDNCGFCTGGSTSLVACAAPPTITIAPSEVSALLIYPNPFESNTLIELTNGEIIQSVTLYNATGLLVFYQDNIHTTFIKLGENLSSGLYSVTILSEKGSYTDKIIKY